MLDRVDRVATEFAFIGFLNARDNHKLLAAREWGQRTNGLAVLNLSVQYE
jgi:hypothetical protein